MRVCVWHDSFICVTRLIHTCDMTHSYVGQDSFICVLWRIRMCDTAHSYVCYDPLVCVTWLISMCDVTHIPICDVTHSYDRHIRMIYMWHVSWHDTFVWSPYTCDPSVTWLMTWHTRLTRHRRYGSVYYYTILVCLLVSHCATWLVTRHSRIIATFLWSICDTSLVTWHIRMIAIFVWSICDKLVGSIKP